MTLGGGGPTPCGSVICSTLATASRSAPGRDVSRLPSRPPELAGYTLIRHLGGGGFADVFLYRQKNLDRDVAVKVLLAADSSADTRRRFEAEGQVMARLSEEHQNIVPVYDAAICSDGRPYLVMQYCPRDDLSKRYKASPLPVAEVLSIGVQLAGAQAARGLEAGRMDLLERGVVSAPRSGGRDMLVEADSIPMTLALMRGDVVRDEHRPRCSRRAGAVDPPGPPTTPQPRGAGPGIARPRRRRRPGRGAARRRGGPKIART